MRTLSGGNAASMTSWAAQAAVNVPRLDSRSITPGVHVPTWSLTESPKSNVTSEAKCCSVSEYLALGKKAKMMPERADAQIEPTFPGEGEL